MPINIKGKEYVTVAERIQEFHRLYPKGSIQTEILTELDAKDIIVRATIIVHYKNEEGRLDILRFTGHSQATKGDGMINKTSALENAETSAVGRALGMLGLGLVAGNHTAMASADEIDKAMHMDEMEICSSPQCGTACDAAVVKWSQTHYGHVLCREHQKSTPKLSS